MGVLLLFAIQPIQHKSDEIVPFRLMAAFTIPPEQHLQFFKITKFPSAIVIGQDVETIDGIPARRLKICK
jgi:hypothetical protein